MVFIEVLEEAKRFHTNSIRLSDLDPNSQIDKITIKEQNFEITLIVKIYKELQDLKTKIKNLESSLAKINSTSFASQIDAKIDELTVKLNGLSINSPSGTIIPKRI